jgi:hypothetical protein
MTVLLIHTQWMHCSVAVAQQQYPHVRIIAWIIVVDDSDFLYLRRRES